MRILVTSARFPQALGEIRRFGECGHAVYAADTFRNAPGRHSRYVTERLLTSSPTFDTPRFISELEDIVRTRGIDLVVPAFEEVFYIARHLPRLRALTRVFCPPFEVLARLHDKRSFVALSRTLGLPVPETTVVTSRAELRAATRAYPEYIARAAFSRGGVQLFTNVGPLAGAVALDECRPTVNCPWIVQDYVHGREVCSFSVARRGRVVAHCAYEHPKTIEHAGGIMFESVDAPDSLAITQRYVEALDYDGQISLDFVRTPQGRLTLLECNPRPTAGIFMMAADAFCEAVVGTPAARPHVVPAGVRAQIGLALVRDMIRDWHEIPADLRALFSGTEDVYLRAGDAMPALYAILSYTHVLAFRHRLGVKRHQHSDIMAAQFYDVSWDGGPIPEVPVPTQAIPQSERVTLPSVGRSYFNGRSR